MAGNKDFSFGILEVASILKLRRKDKFYGRSVDACCPFCGDTKYHLNLNIQKNAFRCNKCGESGGMLRLYGKVMGVDNKEAYKEICEALRIPDESRKIIQREVKKAIENSDSEGEQPDFDKIHKVYTSLFEELVLSEDHKANLIQRGLTEGIIISNKYRSIPEKSMEYEIAQKLLKKCSISDFFGVPGFYMDDENRWKANFSIRRGFLIPVRNFDGKIVGAQIRSDSGTPKYLAFSSSYRKGGTKSTSSVHCVGRFQDFPKTVYLTEGPLKADIAHYFTGYPFLAVQGVNNQKYIEKTFAKLKALGVQRISECFDMDKRKNVQVQKAVAQIEEKAKKHGFSFSSVAWNSDFKGIDDYLCYKHRQLVANS